MKLFLRLLTITTLMSFTGLLYSAEKKERSEKNTSSSTQYKSPINHNIMLLRYTLKNNIAYVKKALENGANVNYTDECGYSALMIASTKGYLDIVNLLIENGANPNTRSQNGYTALMIASESGFEEIVEALINYNNESLDYINLDGETALDLAQENGHDSIVKILSSIYLSLSYEKRDTSTRPLYFVKDGCYRQNISDAINTLIHLIDGQEFGHYYIDNLRNAKKILKDYKIDINNITIRDSRLTLLMGMITAINHIILLSKKSEKLGSCRPLIIKSIKHLGDAINKEERINILAEISRMRNNDTRIIIIIKTIIKTIKSLLPYINDFYVMDDQGNTVFDCAKNNPLPILLREETITPNIQKAFDIGKELDYSKENQKVINLLNQALEKRKAFVRQHINEHLIPQLQNIVFEYAV